MTNASRYRLQPPSLSKSRRCLLPSARISEYQADRAHLWCYLQPPTPPAPCQSRIISQSGLLLCMPAVQHEPVKQARPEDGQLIITKVPGKTPCPLRYLRRLPASAGWLLSPEAGVHQLIVKSVRSGRLLPSSEHKRCYRLGRPLLAGNPHLEAILANGGSCYALLAGSILRKEAFRHKAVAC